MYKTEQMVIYSRYDHPVVESYFGYLSTNGYYIRNNRGEILGNFSLKGAGIFYLGECEGVRFEGNITDKVLCKRITAYFAKYYKKQYTNCATMANFLTTGKFTGCTADNTNSFAVLFQGMRPFSMASKVDIGDMLCIIYARKDIVRSRKFPEIRAKFLKAQKLRRKSVSFASSVQMLKRSFSDKEIRRLCVDSWTEDFHFMVCVGHFEGKPAWLSQRGRVPPGSQGVPVIVTLGECDPYQESDPFFVFIKKRR